MTAALQRDQGLAGETTSRFSRHRVVWKTETGRDKQVKQDVNIPEVRKLVPAKNLGIITKKCDLKFEIHNFDVVWIKILS